jgi:hypothetical protein
LLLGLLARGESQRIFVRKTPSQARNRLKFFVPTVELARHLLYSRSLMFDPVGRAGIADCEYADQSTAPIMAHRES